MTSFSDCSWTTRSISRWTTATAPITNPRAWAGFGHVRRVVVTQARDRDPLQRRPAVGCVPLLAGVQRGGDDAAFLEQNSGNGRRYGGCLRFGCGADE